MDTEPTSEYTPQHGELTDRIEDVSSAYRLVIQLASTPHNSRTMFRLMGMIRKEIGPVDGPRAIVKRETVVLHEACFHPAPSE